MTRSGSWLTVVSSRDNAVNGMANQRVDQVSGDVYGAKTLTNYLNPAAFAQPASGTFGTHVRNSIKGPGFWKVDLACRDSYHWLRSASWSAGTFGRITTTTGDPRIMQFGIKYGF